MSTNDRNWIFKFLARNEWAVLVQISAVLVLLANLWIASQLAPFARDISTIDLRVEALESLSENIVPRSELRAEFNPIKEDIKEIKSDVRDIREAVVK